jgi:mannose/fructose/N-acetylgalactosamine-specific phosphotransferase system component IID
MARSKAGEENTGRASENEMPAFDRYVGPDTWLSSASLGRHALRYAGVVVATAVMMWLAVGLAGGNVYDRRLPVVAFPLSGFVIWIALVTYRRRLDTEMGFLRGLKLGAGVAAISTIAIAILLGLLITLGGDGLRQRHISATRQMLALQRQRLETLPDGKAEYKRQVTATGQVSAVELALDELPRRLVPALLVALLGAILFRKANPEGLEPERAPRPLKQPTR